MKRSILLTVLFTLILSGCEKEQNRELLNAYFKYTINGSETVIKDGAGLNDNAFRCVIKGDTTLTIEVSKFYESAGFYITADSIKDGTYQLNSYNKGYYVNPKDNKRFTTGNNNTGTLVIRKNIFKAKSVLNTLEGTFNFTGIDTLTGKTFTLTNGSFLMERQDD